MEKLKTFVVKSVEEESADFHLRLMPPPMAIPTEMAM